MLEDSPTYRALDLAAKELGWRSNNMGEMISPMLEMKEFPELAHQAARKKSLLRHEGWFVRNGGITVEHLTTSEEISIHLDEFFSQHIARWESTPYPSLFLKSKHQVFYQKLSQLASHTGWFRFTRIIWNERPIAFHFGFNYKGNFFWYKPSFDITLAKNSPGEVLLRQLFLSAQSENSCIFDFGLGDEPFKKRFATKTRKVISWEVYPQ